LKRFFFKRKACYRSLDPGTLNLLLALLFEEASATTDALYFKGDFRWLGNFSCSFQASLNLCFSGFSLTAMREALFCMPLKREKTEDLLSF
jgi:hypothetical protein